MQAWKHRSDGKLYRLNTPQTPIARTQRHDVYHMDEYPSGTNAIVAVLLSLSRQIIALRYVMVVPQSPAAGSISACAVLK